MQIYWKYLKPIQDKFCPNLVQDNTEWLIWLESVSEKVKAVGGAKGFTLDFVSLYDNLDPKLVISALRFAIADCNLFWSDSEIEWLISLVSLSIENGYGRYGNDWFKILHGIPTGSSISVALANITVSYCLQMVFDELGGAPDDLVGYRSYVDDVGGCWIGSVDDFVEFSEKVNNLLFERYGLSIKGGNWEIMKGSQFSVFLDVKFRFDSIPKCYATTK